jgi:hypothetical protein
MKRRHFLGVATASMAGLAGCMGNTEYTVTDVSVADSAGPLALDLDLVDAAATVDSPARLDVTLRNDDDEDISIRNTGVWPLGLLALAQSGERGRGKILLRSDQYGETDRVEVAANGIRTDNAPIVRPLNAGQSVTNQYEIHGNRLYSPGTHTLRGYFEEVPLFYRVGNAEEWTEFYPEATITVEERSLLP